VTTCRSTWDRSFRTEAADVSSSVFTGSAPTARSAANKNSIKIIGEKTDLYAQGYFVYDSMKSGAFTVVAPAHEPAAHPVGVPLVDRAGFVACHQFEFVDKIDVLGGRPRARCSCSKRVRRGRGLGAPAAGNAGADHRPGRSGCSPSTRYDLATRAGMGSRINTIMQTCFFAITGHPAAEEAVAHIKKAIEKSYGKRGPEVVQAQTATWSTTHLAHLHEIPVPGTASATRTRPRRWCLNARPTSSRR
jgi:pyruvate-ferredoxin/flavodoxin oxidoreductase